MNRAGANESQRASGDAIKTVDKDVRGWFHMPIAPRFSTVNLIEQPAVRQTCPQAAGGIGSTPRFGESRAWIYLLLNLEDRVHQNDRAMIVSENGNNRKKLLN